MIPFIDLKSQQDLIKDKLQKRINDVLNHGQYIMGPEIFELEKRLSDFTGSKHCISCASGTDALYMALLALDIKAGDEVIIPDFSFFATAEVVSLLGAKPVFVDINPKTYNIDPDEIENNITDKTKAIIAVSLYGQCADFDAINKIAFNHTIPVIEDAAQSFGATYKGKKSCNLTTIGCTSFFPSKPLGAYGDGGAIFTNDDNIAKAMEEIRIHGQSARYTHTRIGINGRLDTLQAAILLEKMELFENELKLRDEVAGRYTEALRDKFPTPFVEEHNFSAWAQYTIQVENREKVQADLQNKGVPTAVHYPIPISRQPIYGKNTGCEVSLDLSKKVMSLPMSPYLSVEDQKQVISALLSL